MQIFVKYFLKPGIQEVELFEILNISKIIKIPFSFK
jgi:hypothetical protein